MQWWQAYLLTLAVELPVVLVALRAARVIGRDGVSWPRALALVWAINLTHPLLWLIRPTGGALVVAEVFIAVAEGLLLWAGCRRAGRGAGLVCILAATAANATSFLVGLLLTVGA